MGQFSKVNKAVVQAFDSAFRSTMLPNVLDGLARLDEQEQYALAAFRGGARDFSNEQAIREVYKAKKGSSASDARTYLAQIVEKVQKAADAAMAVDLDRAAELAPVASLALTDADVLAMARQHRDDRTALTVLSRADAKAARRLGAAMSRCDEALAVWVEKVGRFGERAIARQSDAKDAAGFSEVVHRAADRMQTAWDELATVIDGGVLGGAWADALMGAGARRA
jgi:hypothetical protein